MKRLYLLLLLLACINIAWQTDSGTTVISDYTTISAPSIEATTVLQSDTLANLLGETRFGGSSNYASFNSAGVLSFLNTSQAQDIQLKNDDMIGWLNNAGTGYVNIGVSATDTFVVYGSMTTVGLFSPTSMDVTLASIGTLAVGTHLRASGNSDFVSASFDNATMSNATTISHDITQATIVHGLFTKATATTLFSQNSDINDASADNITTTGFTAVNATATGVSATNVTTTGTTSTNINATNTVIASEDVDYTLADQVSIETTLNVASGGTVSINSATVGFTGKVKLSGLVHGGNVGTAIHVGADGSLCLTGKCV